MPPSSVAGSSIQGTLYWRGGLLLVVVIPTRGAVTQIALPSMCVTPVHGQELEKMQSAQRCLGESRPDVTGKNCVMGGKWAQLD